VCRSRGHHLPEQQVVDSFVFQIDWRIVVSVIVYWSR
jgi:hypothetical protein